MRKSARGIKPSSKLLESKGIEVDGYTPTAVPDLQKARARDGENAVVVAPLSSPTGKTSDSAAPAAASVDADAAGADADAASADAASADAAPAPTPATDTTDTITTKTTSRPSSASVASTTNEKTSRLVGEADSLQLASNAKMSAPSAGLNLALASASASAGDSTATPQLDVSSQQAESAPLSSKGMFAKVVAAPPTASTAETRLPATTSSANSSAGSGSAPKNSKRVHRTVLEDPLAKRCRLLEIQRNHFKRTLDRVLKLDRYGFILGKDYGGLPTPKGMMTLSQVMKKLEKGSYFAPHVMRDHDWANSRKIVEMLRSRKTYEEVKLLKKSDFLDINWDAIEADLRSIWTFVYKHQPVNEDPRSFYNCAKRLEEFVADNFASTRAKNKEELHKVRDEERLERLTFENREPAMSNWCKKPQERREYTQVDHYKVVEGITEEERAELEDLLDAAGSENRWLLPEDGDAESALNARGAVKKKRRRADGAAAPVSGGLAGNLPFVSWRIKELGKDLLEVDSWGIDPFTRRNLSIALESIDAPDLRMTQPQVNWFIEGLLLRELNRQGPDIGWDLTHALKSLRARAQAGGALSSANSMSHFVNKNETEIKTSLVKTEDQDASTKEASAENQNDTTMEDTKVEESPAAAVTTSATPAEDEAGTASKDANRSSDAAGIVDVAESTATKPESSAASSRVQSADDVLASSSSLDAASASKENSENGSGETAAQHSKTKEAAPETLNGAAKTTRGAAKSKLDSKASRKGSSEGNSTGEVDSLADVVEKIERVGRKRKRTNLVEHENIIWSSRRTRRKPEFFEAVPKVIVTDQTDENTSAASTTTRKRGRGSAAAASTTSRKTTRAGRGKAKSAASQSAANGPSSRKRKAGRGRGGARSRSSTRGGRKAKSNEDLSEVDDIDAENEDDGTEGTTAEGRKLVGKRLSVFRPVECAWFSGRITAFNQNPKEEGRQHCVLFDNGEEAWVDILKDRCIVENVANTTYDRNVSDEMIVAAVDVILRSLQSWGQHNFCVHPKGVGVICLNDKGIQKGDILGSYHGELYPLWLWEQKEAREDALRKQTRAGKTTLPDFWNMRFEIPSSEPKGFTILYVDSKHLGTSMSRLSHSCRPNACVMMAIVDGKYNIAMRALRDIEPGEEVTIDYNCVTDSMDEFRAAICLCGSEGCRGSFLYITGAQQFMQVVERRHQPVHRAAMLFEASLDSQGNPPAASKPVPKRGKGGRRKRSNPRRASASSAEKNVHGLDADNIARMQKYGLKLDLLDRQPVWALRFVALALRFVEQEQLELPSRLFHEELARREKVALSGVNGVQAGHTTTTTEATAAAAAKTATTTTTNVKSTKTNRSTKSNGSAGKTAGKQTSQQTSKRPSSKKAVPAKTATKKSSARKSARAGARRGASTASSKTAKGGKTAQQRTGATSETKAAASGGSQNIPPATQRKRDLDPDSARELWTSVKREAKGIARQRVCNLIIALSKLRHRMDTRIRLGFEGAMENVRPMWTQFQASTSPESFPERAAAAAAAVAVSSSAANRQENWGAMSPTKGRERVSQHNQKVRDLVNETTAKLVERVWWVGDRCEARWCGDDAEDYPGWYSGTILHVHPNPLSKEQGSAYEKSLSSLSGTDANQPTKDSASANPTSDSSEAATPAASQSVPAADSEAASEMPPVPNENGSKMETDAANASEEEAGETTLSADPASKKYFDALLRGPSVHILYDDGSVLNRIPIGSDVLRRPQLTDSPDYPEPHVALSTKTHQSPFRPLTDEDVMNALWNDRANSVMQRVLRLLERTCVYHINVWQAASDPRIKSRYWWNIKTRAIHKGKPPVADRAEKMTYVPKAMREIRELGKYCVGSIEEARDGIRRLRDLVLKVPGVAQSEDGQVWKDGKMDDAHQKLVDLLTFYSLTENWFQVTEAPPVNFYGPDNANANDPTAAHSLHHESSVVAPLLGWLDQKEENMLVEQLMGTTVLPEVESAYTPIEAAKYGSHVRNRLMKQLGDNKKRYQDWDKETQRMFAPAPHVHTDLQADAWPPPLPPPRLFGSPVLDAALFDNRNFDGVASGFEGRLDDVYFKKQVLEEHDKPASAEGDDVFQRLLTALKATRRSASRFPGKEGQMFSPPPPPTVNQHVWIRCEAKDCEKWRKLPAGYSAADFPENFTCSMLKRVDPHFASCTVPEEPSTGESSLKWGYGIGSVDDLQSGHRIDAYHRRSRKWFAVEIVDARTDAVQVVFPKQAGRAEDWLPRHPGPGQFASIMPLYSFSDRADDRSGQRVYRYVETTKRELSKFGPKALMKDYQQYASGAAESSGLPKISIQAVIGTVVDLVNQVSADGGEPLGRVEVKVRRKVLVDEGHLSPSNAGTAATAAGPGLLRRANSTQSSLSATATVRSAAARDRDRYRLVQREAMFMFFKEMKRLYGGLISFEDISRQADALDDRQISYLNPTSWSSNRYGAWVDAAFDEDIGVSMEQDPAERDEEHVVVGMQVMTPDGLGVVLRRTGIRTYCVAVAAARSMRVETQFGWGTVDLVREGTPPIAEVSLDSGARMFAPDLAVEVEYLLVIPVEALVHAKLANVPLEQLLKTRQPRGPRGGDHSPSSSSTTLKREISDVSPFPQPAAVSKVKTEATEPAQAPRVELAQNSRVKADVEVQPMEIVKEASAPDTRAQHGVSGSTTTTTTSSSSSSSSSTSVKQAAAPGTDSEQQTKTLSAKDVPDNSKGAVLTSTSAVARSDSEAGGAAPAKVNAEAVGDNAPESDASKAPSGSVAANLSRGEEKAELDSAESAAHGSKAAAISGDGNAIEAAPSEEKGAKETDDAPGVEEVESGSTESAAHKANASTVSSESAAAHTEERAANDSVMAPGEEKVESKSMESKSMESAAHESNTAAVSSESAAAHNEERAANDSVMAPGEEEVESESMESAAHESNTSAVSSESAAVPAEAKVASESAVVPSDEKVESRSMKSAAHELNAAAISSESAAAPSEKKAPNDSVVAPGEEKTDSRSSEPAAHESNAVAISSESAAVPSEEKAASESVAPPVKEKVESKVLESAAHESKPATVTSDDSAANTTPAELKVANETDTSGSASTEAPAVRKEATSTSEFPTLIANVTKTEGTQEETKSKNESTPSLAPSAS